MPKVVFQPAGLAVEAQAGETLLQVSKRCGAGIKYSCDGAPSCAMCRIVVVAGEENLSPIERKEEDLIGTSYFITKNRLSCQARLVGEGEVRVDLTQNQESRGEKKRPTPAPGKGSGRNDNNRPRGGKPQHQSGFKGNRNKGPRPEGPRPEGPKSEGSRPEAGRPPQA